MAGPNLLAAPLAAGPAAGACAGCRWSWADYCWGCASSGERAENCAGLRARISLAETIQASGLEITQIAPQPIHSRRLHPEGSLPVRVPYRFCASTRSLPGQQDRAYPRSEWQQGIHKEIQARK